VSTARALILTMAVSLGPASGPVSAEAVFTNVRQLSDGGPYGTHGTLSPGGELVAFESVRGAGVPTSVVLTREIETAAEQQASPEQGRASAPVFHPTEDRLLFASTHDAEAPRSAIVPLAPWTRSFDPEFEVYSAKADGGGLVRLTKNDVYDGEPAYSTDGARIAFSSARDPAEEGAPARNVGQELDLYVMGWDGSGAKRLTEEPGYEGGAAFSPDGKRIAFHRFGLHTGRSEIWTVRPDGTGARQVTRLGATSWGPAYHPSGSYLVFASNAGSGSGFSLYLVDPKGEREPALVTERAGFDAFPSFSADGKTLVWTSNRTRSGTAQIFRADWGHEAARKVLAPAKPADGEGD